MANIKLSDLPERIQKSVKLYADFGGFGDEYQAIVNSQFKNDMFLTDLAHYIDQKKYQAIIASIEYENPMILDAAGKMSFEDEKTIRRSLREFGFKNEDFYNPKYNKDELVVWDNRLFKIRSGFMDMGANYYSLTDIEHGHEVGGRLRESELQDPTALQKISYYKDQGMLDIHLFNKMAFMTGEFDIAKAKIEKHDISVTQGSHDLFYDGVKIISFDAGKKLDGKGNWVGISDKERYKTLEKLFYEGHEPYTNTKPIKENYGLQEQLDFLVAIKGFDAPDGRFNEFAEAAAKGFIDRLSHYNLLAMLSHDTKAPIKRSSDVITNDEIKAMETLAIRKLKNDDLLKDLQADLDDIKNGIALYEMKDEDKKSLLSSSIFYERLSDRDIFKSDVGDFYGSAHWFLKAGDLDLFTKIEKFWDKSLDYIMERDLLRLQRPDMEAFIKESHLFLDKDRENLFRGSHPDGYVSSITELKAFDKNWDELDIADNGFRRCLFNKELLADFTYCEGDLSLGVFKNKEDFSAEINRVINFYAEDENISSEKIHEVKKYFLADEYNLDSMMRPEVDVLSADEKAKSMKELSGAEPAQEQQKNSNHKELL